MRSRWLLFVLASVPLQLAAAPSSVGQDAGSSVDFLRDVRPILSKHCFPCHGPDEKTRKAGLRLDVREAALQPARSDATAIVPGHPETSELVTRILSTDDDELMPPPAAKLPLTETQKGVLRRWIGQGAEYQPHWSFVAPVRPEVPSEGTPQAASNPIDAFIRSRLLKEGLEPSPEADRLTLVRRLHLDLVGLPPTPAEADAFLQDTSPDAYERLVDRLLASKHYGERWARRWMDLARYADTNGYEKDRVRSMWPWRDWVIDAFNADMPFEEFTVEQLAGDMLPGATPSQQIATGFHRNTMINEEGGIDPLEYRFHAMVDRVHTTATTWLGLTMACAQCHTHKFDPIQHREYYQFMAFLDNADEPVMDVVRPSIEEQRKVVEARIRELENGLIDRFPAEERVTWVTPPPTEVETRSGAPTERLADGSLRVTGATPDRDAYTLVFQIPLTNVTLLNLDVLADEALPRHGPGRAENGNFVLSELTLTAAPLDSAAEAQEVRIATASADFEQSGFPVRNSFDGKTNTGWAISTDSNPNRNRRATFRLEKPLGFPGGTRVTLRLQQEHGASHVLGRFRLSFGVDEENPATLETRGKEHFARKYDAWQRQTRSEVRTWTVLNPASATSNVPVLTIEEDGSVFASSDQTKSDTYELLFKDPPPGITALRLEALPDDRLPARGPGRVYYEGPLGDFFLSTFALAARDEPVRLVRPSQSFASGRNDAAQALDADQQTGWSIHGGQGRRHVAVFNLDQPLSADALRVKMLFERYYAAGIGRFRISVTTDPRGAAALSMTDALQEILQRDAADRTAEEEAELRQHFASIAPELAPAREAIEKIRREMPAYPTTLVMQERPRDNPRTTLMRNRGEFLQPLEAVQPALPAIFAETAKASPSNRLDFARWLVSRENPLTARVTVNRQWQAFMGRGLVATMEDFGFQGALPTHPDLLDWLAVEFMDQGWSLKKLNKLIVMSATYRQSSRVTPLHLEKDPENRWLARGPRFRIEAELVRDLALRASGLLSTKLGGPSVFPPQLPSITKEGAYGPLEWVVSSGEDRYRRGLYTFAKRTAPYASFRTFDAPSGEACVARRDLSNTPLQSLTLLNDAVFVEAARALGRETAAVPGDVSARAEFVFRRCLTRTPEPGELYPILEFYRSQRARMEAGHLDAATLGGGSAEADGDVLERAAWTAVARALLNLDETVTRG